VYTLFDTYDADGNGSIEITELRRLLEDVTAREERASGRQKEERSSPSSGLVPQEHYKDGMEQPIAQPIVQQTMVVTCPAGVPSGGLMMVTLGGVRVQVAVPPGIQPGQTFQVAFQETATQYTSPPPSPPSTEAQAIAASRTTNATTTPHADSRGTASSFRIQSSRRRSTSKEFFEGALRSPSIETTRVKRELAKVSQELLDQSQMWRLKTYYVFPVVEKMRHLDHISRIVFPTVYAIYLLAMLSEVNFGADQRKLLESKMDCYAGQ
jgi:hypothetical protein